MKGLELEFRGRSTTTTWMFYGKQCAWAHISINEETGEVTIHSDFGVFGHRWNPRHAASESIAEFVATAHAEYLLRKFGYENPSLKDVADDEGTERWLKTEILQARRNGELTARKARYLWRDVEEFSGELYGNNIDFALMEASSDLWDFCPDLCHIIQHKPSVTFEIMEREVIPAMQKHLKAELSL